MALYAQVDLDWAAQAPLTELVDFSRVVGLAVDARPRTISQRAAVRRWIRARLAGEPSQEASPHSSPRRGLPAPAGEAPRDPSAGGEGGVRRVGPEASRQPDPGSNTLNLPGGESSGEESFHSTRSEESGSHHSADEEEQRPGALDSRFRPLEENSGLVTGRASPGRGGPTQQMYRSGGEEDSAGWPRRRDYIPPDRHPAEADWERRDRRAGYQSGAGARRLPTRDGAGRGEYQHPRPPHPTGYLSGHGRAPGGPAALFGDPAPYGEPPAHPSLDLLRRQLDLAEAKLVEKRKLREVQERLLQLQLDAVARSSGPAGPVGPGGVGQGRASRDSPLIKTKGHLLQPWREEEDLREYLELFESMCAAGDVPPEDRGMLLVSLLTGKAKRVVVSAPPEVLRDYLQVRALLHESFDFTADSFRLALRTQTRAEHDSYLTLLRHSMRTWDCWMALEKAKTADQVRDVCMREVLVKAAPEALRLVLLDAGPMTAPQMAQKCNAWEKNRQRIKAEAALFKSHIVSGGKNVSNEKNAYVTNSSSTGNKGSAGTGERSQAGLDRRQNAGRDARGNQAPVKGGAQGSRRGDPDQSQGGAPKRGGCFICGKTDHFKSACPSLKAKTTAAERVNAYSESGEVVEHMASISDRARAEGQLPPVLRREIVDLSLNGEPIRALPDSGASITCVKADNVLPAQYTGEIVPVDYANGSQGEVPLAKVQLTWEGDEGPEGRLRRVGVCESQKLDCYLGMDYLKEMRAAITRSQARKKAEARVAAMGGAPLEVPWDLPARGKPTVVSFGWGDTPAPPELVANSGEGSLEVDPMALWTPGTLELHDPRAFKEALGSDSSLEQLKAGAYAQRPKLEELSTPRPRYMVYWEGGLLYSELTSPSLTEPSRRMVVPLKYRGELLRLGHEIPTAGHLGLAKTRARVLGSFYWPTISRDLEAYVRTCEVCQLSGKSGGKSKAPLVSMPVVGTPFQRIGMDIVGPLNTPSSSGKRYILVVVDYATRYPEAVALRSISTKAVAEALMGIFARVGFPSEVISDRGTQFMSAVMHSLWHLSGVQHHPSTAYHPETNGLCERFNGTLKSMLLAFAEQHGRQWEKYLPYILFAYREVPQESTGFSPFELLYGWRVKGPLQLVKEGWEGRHVDEGQAIVPYVLNLREKLRECMQVSAESIASAQTRQKRWYDHGAKVSSYEEGQEVLLLVPVKQNKMAAAWTGPHKVVRKVSAVNYVVDREDKPGVHSTYHVNMMKPYYRRTECTMSICEGDTLYAEEAGIPDLLQESKVSGDLSTVQLAAELSDKERQDLLEVLAPFDTTFSSKPGVVRGVVHDVDTGEAAPVRTNPYKVSPAVGASIRKEVHEMLELGVIEHSSSAWASPIVLVQKKDHSTRFCTDYRRLNVITKSDAHPLPRIDDLLDKLGPAKFITTMDLTKGYWQVALTERAKERSAFTCPEGLFQYTVMPFGMKNAPATFQRLMNSVLRGLESFAVAYLDDIAVYSQDWTSHLEHLTAVLARLQETGLTVKAPKCQFAQGEVEYLGHFVGKGHLRPLRAKVEAIEQWPVPTTKRQVRAFLGTAGYYRSFVPRYSTIAAPLTGLLVNKAPRRVVWTAECQKAFDTLKAILCDEPVLTSPDPSKTLYVQTDASDVGIGAVLSQKCDSGRDRPVVYLSRKLLPREQRWSVAERECLAVVWALKKLQPYIYGVPFVVQTDHNPLTFLHSLGDASGKLLRWSLALQDYQFEVQHRSGAKNGNADGLSRMTSEEVE